MFSTFLKCPQMSGEFYYSVINNFGFFSCFLIWILHVQNNETRFFYVLYSDKTWVFDQSEHVQGPTYIIKSNRNSLPRVNTWLLITCTCNILTTLQSNSLLLLQSALLSLILSVASS